jgi:hypothetical protein
MTRLTNLSACSSLGRQICSLGLNFSVTKMKCKKNLSLPHERSAHPERQSNLSLTENHIGANKFVGLLLTRPTSLSACSRRIWTKELGYFHLRTRKF